MSLKIYNTLSRKKEKFVPLKEGEVKMYVCGVTVYDRCHVGHARALFTFDVVLRYLRFLGYKTTFVRNFTDLDDKIIQRARAEGSEPVVIAEKYIKEFNTDSTALGLISPDQEPRATDHVPEMIDLIHQLVEKGLAYRIDGDVFFSVDRFAPYGKLSGRKLEELQAGVRVEVDERKKHPMDFALWKQSKEGEPSWKSPWGEGRPGWHIECSAMSVKYLGQPFDIHGGGADLVFPHHENEIAQSEGASDLMFARYWMHNGFVNINQEKMSKSLGNIYTIQEVLDRYDAASLRHYILASHYRSPLDFSDQGLEEAEKGMDRIYDTVHRLNQLTSPNGERTVEEGILGEFRKEMDDDFNTPRALALLFEEIRSLNRLLDKGEITGLTIRRDSLKKVGEVLGLIQESPETFWDRKKKRWLHRHGLTAQEIEEKIRLRNLARNEKRWDEADRIRNELSEKGIALEDTTGGTLWKVR
jgi:cysteinyl-tRNA synthetase